MKSKVIEERRAHGLGNPVLNDVVDELLRIAGIEVHDCALDYPERQVFHNDLEAAGFINRGGKGSHRNFVHPKVAKIVTLSGNPGDDVKHYQERAVKTAIEESRK